MLLSLLALLVVALVDEPQLDLGGTIIGVVLNGSRANEPIADAEVQLRAGTTTVLEPVETARTDLYGRFVFRDLPLDRAIVYLPGANRDGVHYPGQRITLDSSRVANVKIVAFDAVHSASPLTADRHDINIAVDENVIKVTETLTVSNRSNMTYVGESNAEGSLVSLRLSIPELFDRVTFDREFFGRRFRVVDHRVVTDVPWPPGDKELKFTYQLPLEQSAGLFRRHLDLPCSQISVRVHAKPGLKLTCNLPRQASTGDDALFASTSEQLPSGFAIDVRIDESPVQWLRYARWGSLGVLCSMILATVIAHWMRATTTTVVAS